MRTTGVAMALLVLSAAGCVAVQPTVSKTAKPSEASGYVGGIFSKDTITGFGFGVLDLKTNKDYVISVAAKDVSLVELPPGTYRIAYWVTFAITGEQLKRQEIPESRPLARPFDLEAGHVVLLGKWTADREMGFGTNRFTLQAVKITEREAVAAFRESYPGFGDAPAACLICLR